MKGDCLPLHVRLHQSLLSRVGPQLVQQASKVMTGVQSLSTKDKHSNEDDNSRQAVWQVSMGKCKDADEDVSYVQTISLFITETPCC